MFAEQVEMNVLLFHLPGECRDEVGDSAAEFSEWVLCAGTEEEVTGRNVQGGCVGCGGKVKEEILRHHALLGRRETVAFETSAGRTNGETTVRTGLQLQERRSLHRVLADAQREEVNGRKVCFQCCFIVLLSETCLQSGGAFHGRSLGAQLAGELFTAFLGIGTDAAQLMTGKGELSHLSVRRQRSSRRHDVKAGARSTQCAGEGADVERRKKTVQRKGGSVGRKLIDLSLQIGLGACGETSISQSGAEVGTIVCPVESHVAAGGDAVGHVHRLRHALGEQTTHDGEIAGDEGELGLSAAAFLHDVANIA